MRGGEPGEGESEDWRASEWAGISIVRLRFQVLTNPGLRWHSASLIECTQRGAYATATAAAWSGLPDWVIQRRMALV